MNKRIINISKEFSMVLGARMKQFGQFSGEEFREKFLSAYFENSSDNTLLIIELDGVIGYPWSFLDESFGKIARKYGVEKVKEKIKFVSSNEQLKMELNKIIGINPGSESV